VGEEGFGDLRVGDGNVVIDMTDDDIDDGVVFGFEQEKRRRFIANIRAENDKACAELDREVEACALTRPIEHPNDRHRREIDERNARWAAEREREQKAAAPAAADLLAEVDRRIRASALMISTEVASTLKADGRALNRELADLRGMLAKTLESFVTLSKQFEAEKHDSDAGKIVDIAPARRAN
jgi:hypothetical protein